MMCLFRKYSFIVLLALLPLFSSAQLTSENYQVDGYSVGSSNQTLNASSTNYSANLETGGLYEYGAPVVTPPGGGGGGGGGKKIPPAVIKKEVAGSATTSLLIGPSKVKVGDTVTLAVVVKTSDGVVSNSGTDVIIFTVTGPNSVTLTGTYIGSGVYTASYIATKDGIDTVRARINGAQILRDTDGAQDGKVSIEVQKKGKPEIPPGQEKKTVPPTLPPDTDDDDVTPPADPEPFALQFGVTQACNRAFAWNRDLASSVYRTVNDGEESLIATTVAVMPWYVDIDPHTLDTLYYRFVFSDGTTETVSFLPDQFLTCTPSDDSVVTEDVDDDQNEEQYIEGIYQDPDGSTVPLAITPDGIVLDSNADNIPDRFWNPSVGVSTLIAAGDRLFITDSNVAPTQTYQPLETGSYRVTLSPLPNGNVALVISATSLVALNDLVPFEPQPFSVSTMAFIDTVGIGAGLISVLLRFSKIPFSLIHFGRMLSHVGSNLFGLLVFRKRRRPWGTVYDSVTKAPVDPAYVELFDMKGEKQTEAVTDLDGRYGFLAPEGTYTMKVSKTNYTFPSKHINITGQDVLYTNLYFGGTFEISDAVTHDVPMDPTAYDWNQHEKMRTHQTRFIHRFDPIIVRALDILFYVGAVAMVWQFMMVQDMYSAVLLFIYVVLLILRFSKGGPILYGTLLKNGSPLAFAVVRIMREERQFMAKVTDELGRYVAIVPPGSYTITVDERVGEEEYVQVYSDSVDARRGVINRTIKL